MTDEQFALSDATNSALATYLRTAARHLTDDRPALAANLELAARRLDATEKITDVLKDFIRLGDNSRASSKNPNTTFVDTRDWESFLSRARSAIKVSQELAGGPT